MIRLDDLRSAQAQWISDSYYLTGEAKNHFDALKKVIGMPTGRGMFVLGHYGCGKSHFLAYLAQQIESGQFIEICPRPVCLSLLNFSCTERLEKIVTDALGIALDSGDRRVAWQTLGQSNPAGTLLLLDELSEFLRSKPDRHSLTEDIRFLQFMGEWAQDQPFWILAAMQEQIEHTGDLEYSLYRKIKDRYPLRFLLTPTHVRDLIADNMLVKKPEYAAAVDELYSHVKQALPGSPLNQLQFNALYPIHPVTLEFLEEIRDCFSQTRGIVDFTVSQLAGNEARGIKPFLDRPWGELLTPDYIVSHFQDLMQIQPEFLELSQKLFPYYQKSLNTLFDKDLQRRLAGQLINLLVLTYISPLRKGLSSAEAVYWLLFKATRVDPDKNRLIIDHVLEHLLEKGKYIKKQGERYVLDLEEEGASGLERLIQREVKDLHNHGDTIFELLVPLLPINEFNPFMFESNQWLSRSFRWHFHDRHYAVCIGQCEQNPKLETALCIGKPWGEPMEHSGTFTLQPQKLTLKKEHIELAAMARLNNQPLQPGQAKRLRGRMNSHLALFSSDIYSAYDRTQMMNTNHVRENMPKFDPHKNTNKWIEAHIEWILRRTYPAFERFAPSHGPLAKEAYRTFMRFVSNNDLTGYEADETIRLIREAYLVPMGLLQRKGREYRVPSNLEKHELVRLLQTLLDHQPSPKLVYQHLSNPIYGLVPDQIHLLLLFLLVMGELDIVKGTHSLREHFETLPLPWNYDHIVPGEALTVDQLQALQKLCEGLNIPLPKQWTVSAQRRIVKRLQETARHNRDTYQPLLIKLESMGQGKKIVDNLNQLLQYWSILVNGRDEFHCVQQFLYEIGSPGRFLSLQLEWQSMPERIHRLLDELERYRHLMHHPALQRNHAVNKAMSSIGVQPSLDSPESIESWLSQTKAIYQTYADDYRSKHNHWWATVLKHDSLNWQPPKLAISRHLALEEQIQALHSCRDRIAKSICRELVNLDFQPVCNCGFDGTGAPVEKELQLFDSWRHDLDTAIMHFFQQATVKKRIQEWQTQGLEVNSKTLSYLQGKSTLPEIDNIELFDQHMAGLDLVKQIDINELIELFGDANWKPMDLVKSFEQFVARYKNNRLRFVGARQHFGEALLEWSVKQSLGFGVALPLDLNPAELHTIGKRIFPQWVGPAALEKLEDLGLGEEILKQVLNWLINGQCEVPTMQRVSPLVSTVLQLQHPIQIQTVQELATQATQAFRYHPMMMQVDKNRWLEYLNNLSSVQIGNDIHDITQVLKSNQDAQWLILDCFGLALLESVLPTVIEILVHWRLVDTSFAMVSLQTSTDAFYTHLCNNEINYRFEKVDTIDNLIHNRFLPFDDLCRIITAELHALGKKLVKRFDTKKSILVFADHGFRIAKDGKSYQHGGASSLERMVPVLNLQPR